MPSWCAQKKQVQKRNKRKKGKTRKRKNGLLIEIDPEKIVSPSAVRVLRKAERWENIPRVSPELAEIQELYGVYDMTHLVVVTPLKEKKRLCPKYTYCIRVTVQHR